MLISRKLVVALVVGLGGLAAAALGGCKDKKADPGHATTGGGGGGGAAGGGGGGAAAVPTQPVGMADPFARLSSEAGKSLDKAWKAARAKKWDDAQAAFREVTTAAPDYVQARWGLVRALILGGKLAEVPAAFEELIARDYIGYATKLDKGKELAAIRSAPEWAKIEDLKTRYRTAYAAGLDKGLAKGMFFVARTRPAADPKVDAATGEATLDLKQEVFHVDNELKRYRRLTDTDGHAFAIDLTTDGKMMSFLVATKVKRDPKSSEAFVDPKVGVIDLATLETLGPWPVKGTFEQVVLGQQTGGQPLFSFTAGGQSTSYIMDTAKTGLAKAEGAVPEGGETRAWPGQVVHVPGKTLDDVQIADGQSQFKIATVVAPVVAARPIAASSLDWSPAKKRLTYAGKLDACKILQAGSASTEKNELYVYDMEKKAAQRIASGVSAFETLWLDDDRLVYESGVGKGGQLRVYTFSTHADQALPPRNGAGIYGVPTLSCERAETKVDEPVAPEDEPDGD
jgi:hypothetical protein